MDTFFLEVPGPEREGDALVYLQEFHACHSNINGTGGLDRFSDNYAGWLEKLEQDARRPVTEKKVPARTFFLVRAGDREIVGMINIRLALNEALKQSGGNIGYSIRPTQRKKGYNKINLYLGLRFCREQGMDRVLLSADEDNPASWRTMEALSGRLLREAPDPENPRQMERFYEILVGESLARWRDVYEPQVARSGFCAGNS